MPGRSRPISLGKLRFRKRVRPLMPTLDWKGQPLFRKDRKEVLLRRNIPIDPVAIRRRAGFAKRLGFTQLAAELLEMARRREAGQKHREERRR